MKYSATKGTFFLTISSILVLIAGYVTSVWLGRNLGPEDYGIYGIIISIITFVNFIQTSGLTQTVSKHIAEDVHNSESILKTGLVLQVISTGIYFSVFFFGAKYIATFLNDIQLVSYIKLSSFAFLFYGIYALYSDYYNGLHFFKKQSIMNILYSTIRMFFIIIFAYFFGIKGAFVAFIIAPFLPLIYGFHVPKSKQYFPFKKIIKFSIPLMAFAFFYNTLLSLDLILLKVLSNSSLDPGYYTASQNIARLPLVGIGAVFLVILPSISKSVSSKNSKKTLLLIQQSMRFIMLFILPGILLISTTSKQLINLLYSSMYLPSASSLSILVIGMGFSTILTAFMYILNGAGKPHISLIITSIGVIVSSLLCFILIPLYNLNGAALSTTIGNLVVMFIAGFVIYRKFGCFISFLSLSKIAVASFIISFLASNISVIDILLPCIYILLFGIYFLLLIWMKEITSNDWKQVKVLIPSWMPFLN